MPNIDARNARVRVTWIDPQSGARSWQEWEADAEIHDTNLLAGAMTTGSPVIITLTAPEELPPAPTLEVRLAMAALDGDTIDALALSDDIQERHARPDGFVSREELLALLKEIEWSDEGFFCPICNQTLTSTHKPDCRLARALGRSGS